MEFISHNHQQVMRFRYQGGRCRLKLFLLERYGEARGEEWKATFFPDRVRLNGAEVNEETMLEPGDEVAYLHLRSEEPPPPPLQVLHDDEALTVLLKPDHQPVHPAGVFHFTSLALMARKVLGRPALAPVHRLDLETSGPVVFAAGPAEARHLQGQFVGHQVQKRYRALVHGHWPVEQTEMAGWVHPLAHSAIHTRLGFTPQTKQEEPPPAKGQYALTRVWAVEHLNHPKGPLSDLWLEPVTGRTNQLRVQLSALGHPIVGDKKYHPDEGVFLQWMTHRRFEPLEEALWLPRQALHCQFIQFTHPHTQQPLRVESPPEVWQAVRQALPEVASLSAPVALFPPSAQTL